MNEHRPEPPYTTREAGAVTPRHVPGADFQAGELTPWQDLSRAVAFLTEKEKIDSVDKVDLQDKVDVLEGALAELMDQHLGRGLKTLEGSVASLATQMDNRSRELEGSVEFLQSLALPGKLKLLGQLEHEMDIARDIINGHTIRDQQLIATIEGVDAHLEEMEKQQEYDREMVNGLEEHVKELYITFQASIDKLDAKFDEYMGYVRATSHTTVGHATRITQLEQAIGQQKVKVDTILHSYNQHIQMDGHYPTQETENGETNRPEH